MIISSDSELPESFKIAEDRHMVKIAKDTIELGKRNTLGQLSMYEKSKLLANADFLASMIIKGINL